MSSRPDWWSHCDGSPLYSAEHPKRFRILLTLRRLGFHPTGLQFDQWPNAPIRGRFQEVESGLFIGWELVEGYDDWQLVIDPVWRSYRGDPVDTHFEFPREYEVSFKVSEEMFQ